MQIVKIGFYLLITGYLLWNCGDLSVSEEYRQVPINYSIFSMFIDLRNSAREHVALSQGDICSFVRDSRNRGKRMFAIESGNLLDLVKIR